MTPVQQHLTFLCSVPSSWSVSLQMHLYILCTCGSKRLAWDHTFYAIAAFNNWKIVRIMKNAHHKSKHWKCSVLSDQHNQKCHYFTFKQSIKVPMSRIWKFPTLAYWHTCIENCKSPPVFFFHNLLVANKNTPKRDKTVMLSAVLRGHYLKSVTSWSTKKHYCTRLYFLQTLSDETLKLHCYLP